MIVTRFLSLIFKYKNSWPTHTQKKINSYYIRYNVFYYLLYSKITKYCTFNLINFWLLQILTFESKTLLQCPLPHLFKSQKRKHWTSNEGDVCNASITLQQKYVFIGTNWEKSLPKVTFLNQNIWRRNLKSLTHKVY